MKKIENTLKEEKLIISELNLLTSNEQYKKVEETLNIMYEGKIEIEKAFVLKCLKLLVAKEDDIINLRNNLVVEKNAKYLIFNFKKQKKILPAILLLIAALIAATIFATYNALIYIAESKVNIDIDNDGIPDINLDFNNDYEPEINIDINNDNKPDVNIDYKGNNLAIFNLDEDNDGEPDSNLVNDATGDNVETCKVNCDSNGDGWPDYNYDIDGDGKADLDIAKEGTDEIYLNIDINGDQLCDAMCDDDGDGVCDRACSPVEEGENTGSGSSSVTGNPDNNLNSSGNLNIIYEDGTELVVNGLLPDDQPGTDPIYPQKSFTITNKSNVSVIYNLEWVVKENTFTSDNFEYMIESDNNGYNVEFTPSPKVSGDLVEGIIINANETQSYTITFRLKGTGENQDYDQGKSFSGYLNVTR